MKRALIAFLILCWPSLALAQSMGGGGIFNPSNGNASSPCSAFGTTAGTCAQGNDSRITGAIQGPATAAQATLAVDVLYFGFTGVNFNATNGTDIAHLVVALPTGASGFTLQTRIYNCTAAITTAHVGVFDGAGATGNTISGNTTGTITGTSAAAAASSQLISQAATIWYNSANLYLNLIAQQGSAVTCSVVFFITVLP